MLYNMPAMTKTSFHPETVKWALDQESRIVGLKDSSGDLVYFRKMTISRRESPARLVVARRPEELLAEAVLLGGHGGINGGANLRPQLYVDLFHAAKSGDLVRTRDLAGEVMAFSSAL